MFMPDATHCPACGADLPPGQPKALCARCAFKGALDLGEETAPNSGQRAKLAGDTPPLHNRIRYFGDYELIEEIARGGMGVVYRARQTSLNRDVALKMILAGHLARPEDVRRFRAEAEAAAGLQHPNIVAIHEVGEHEGHHYFSMDLVEGTNLAQFLRDGPLPARRAAGYVKIVSEAIHFAHTRGILHRDLKPSNVLIDSDDAPKVTDFGLAKNLAGDSSLTVTGQVYGSPSFMPPEQASGQRANVGVASDVYSLGAILYHTLTGRPPFMGQTIAETLKQVENTDPIAPRLLNPGLPRDLETICLKCLQKEPGRRYASAQELAEELGRVLDDEPVRARPVSRPEKLWRWCGRKPALAGAAGVAVLLFFVIVIGSPMMTVRIDRQRERAEEQTQLAQGAVTRLEIERAESMFAVPSTARGVAYLARLLRQSPSNQVVAERLVSALNSHNYCLPGAPPLTHAAKITCAQFSPDGELVITSSKDATACLWSTRSGTAVGEPLRHNAGITWVEFSPDGQSIVTASEDGTARVWNVQSQKPVSPPLRHDWAVLYAAFSPDGSRVVTASQDRTVRCWDWRLGAAASPPIMLAGTAYFACFSPDGNDVLTATDDGTARIFSCDDGRELATYPHQRQPDSAVSFPQYSPKGDRVMVFQTGGARIFDRTRDPGPPIHLLHGHDVTSAVFSRDGRLVATGSLDNTAAIWNARTGAAVINLNSEDDVLAVCLSGDENLLLTGSADKKLLITGVKSTVLVSEPLRHESRVTQVRFSPTRHQALAVTDGNHVVLWNVRRVKVGPRVLQHESQIHHAVFSPDGLKVATASRDRTARVWDPLTGQPLTGPLQQNGWMNVIRFSPDGRRIATVSSQKEVQVWDSSTGEALFKPDAQVRVTHISNLQFSPNGETIAIATGSGGVAWILDSVTGRALRHLAHSNSVFYVTYSPDGRHVATTCQSGVTVWNVFTGEPTSSELRHDDTVYWADFSPNGSHLATASRDKTVRIWEVKTGRMLTKPLIHADALGDKHSVQFSSDGKWVATAAGKTAQVWNAATGERSALQLEHVTPVKSVRFSPDGTRLITATAEVRVWDVATGHALSESLQHRRGCNYAEFSPDGQFALTALVDGTARIWWVPQVPRNSPEWLPDLAEALSGRRIDETGSSEIVPVKKLFEVAQKVINQPVLNKQPGSPTTGDGGFYSAWGRWFLTENVERVVPPWALPTTADRYKAPEPGGKTARLASDKPRDIQLQAESLERRGDLTGALAVLDQAIEQLPNDPAWWRLKGALLQKVNQTNEAITTYSKSIELALRDTNAFDIVLRQAQMARSELLMAMSRWEEATVDRLAALGIPPRRPELTPDSIDLGPFYNFRLRSILRIPPEQTDLRFQEDIQLRTGVPFDLRGAVALAGKAGAEHFPGVEKQPTLLSFAGIPVNRKLERLHFLHGTSKHVPDGTVIGAYVLHYADGRTASFPILYGQDIRDWWGWQPAREKSGARPAWTWDKHNYPFKGPVRLYQMTRENPYPEVEVKSFDFVSARTDCAPFLVAVTTGP
jgi:WD40 repeat protein/tRNA A-37 threonylcarbamoyl transferase component Bud32/tetratricopeptide (TPR) repeat protein